MKAEFKDIERLFNEVFAVRFNLNTDPEKGKYYTVTRRSSHSNLVKVITIDPENRYVEHCPYGSEYLTCEEMYHCLWFTMDTMHIKEGEGYNLNFGESKS